MPCFKKSGFRHAEPAHYALALSEASVPETKSLGRGGGGEGSYQRTRAGTAGLKSFESHTGCGRNRRAVPGSR